MQFDVIVIGAGHAGVEASAASARTGARTLCVTLRADRIGHLPCNCSIGGPAKGHIAREVDALDGLMGVITDETMTHIRRVGTGKGPAVQTARAHVCKKLYPLAMRRELQKTPNLTVIEGLVDEVITANGEVCGLTFIPTGETQPVQVSARAIIITAGTFLNGLCHEGRNKTVGGRHGDQAAIGLSKFLSECGIRLRRFKTGTTPRLAKSSIDFDRVLTMPSEPDAGPFSFITDRIFSDDELLPCWQTHTNEATHTILRDNLSESAMFAGEISGVGPRYCPSVEDKVVRFADKTSHPVFLEQEEWDDESMYVQGFSTSMPAEIQLAAIRTIVGLERAHMLRPGYAVEYDMADPTQLDLGLMSRLVPGLFLAGQINGTSGYEEAAGQGIVAGLNASRFALGREPLIFARDSSFIGVMIDDLVTRGVDDPYRMLTSRAEHRLLLRHDNADRRLTPVAREAGACSDARWAKFEAKMTAIEQGRLCLQQFSIGPNDEQTLQSLETSSVKNRASGYELLRRPELTHTVLRPIMVAAGIADPCKDLSEAQAGKVWEQLEIEAKLQGYIEIQERAAKQSKGLDEMLIPPDFDYCAAKGLSHESIDKLGRARPLTIGQASRIGGIRPSDITLLMGLIRRERSQV